MRDGNAKTVTRYPLRIGDGYDRRRHRGWMGGALERRQTIRAFRSIPGGIFSPPAGAGSWGLCAPLQKTNSAERTAPADIPQPILAVNDWKRSAYAMTATSEPPNRLFPARARIRFIGPLAHRCCLVT